MQIDNLDDFDPGSEFEADIAIIGAGPAGITIAREFLNSPYRVLLIESGLVDEHEPHATLNHVESEGEPAGEATIRTKPEQAHATFSAESDHQFLHGGQSGFRRS
jgi:2-polyprenyl-6-methoxyphenol hydroxylase-like FAD-dependent oxidoreductase